MEKFLGEDKLGEDLKSKYLELVRCKRELVNRCLQVEPHFSLVVAGSSVYGYKQETDATFEDLDCHALLPESLSYEDFVAGLGRILDSVELPSPGNYSAFLSGEVDVLRVLGTFNGIKVSMAVFNFPQLNRRVSPFAIERPMRHLVPDIPKFRADHLVSSFGAGQLVTPLEIVDEDAFAAGKQIVVNRYFGRRISGVNGGSVKTVEPLANNFLIGEILYQMPGMDVQQMLDRLWSIYVRGNIDVKDYLDSDLNISRVVSGHVRAARFAPEFEDSVRARVQAELYRLRSLMGEVTVFDLALFPDYLERYFTRLGDAQTGFVSEFSFEQLLDLQKRLARHIRRIQKSLRRQMLASVASGRSDMDHLEVHFESWDYVEYGYGSEFAQKVAVDEIGNLSSRQRKLFSELGFQLTAANTQVEIELYRMLSGRVMGAY